MKKILLTTLAISLLIGIFTAGTFRINAVDNISAHSAVIIEAGTGKILYSKNENEKRSMASTTKIMTALLCLESGNLDEEFIVDANAIKVEGSSMGLLEGDTVTKRALCYGMLLPSGNDAANVVALKLGGTIENFAKLMNERAEKIGMENTNFVTPSGLEGIGHNSTAYDMAILAREAMNNADFADICKQKSAKLKFGNPPYERWLKNSNKLLDYYNGCIGIKTGFTDEAGRCLVSAAEKDGIRLIAVTLKASDDWNDHKKMLDYGFSIVKNHLVDAPTEATTVKIVGSDKDVIATMSEPFNVSLVDGGLENITSKVILPKFLYAPVGLHQEIGKVQYYFEGKLIFETPIKTAENAEPMIITKKDTLFDKIKLILIK